MTDLRLLDCGPSLRGWSNQELIMACPHRWALVNLGDHTRIPADPLVKGSLVHAGLAHYWSQRMGVPGLLSPVDAVRVLAAQEDRELAARYGYSETWGQWVNLAVATVDAYVSARTYAHITPRAVEQQVNLWCGRAADGSCSLVAVPPDADARLDAAARKDWARFYAMGQPWLTTFRADLIGELPDGRVVVVDHKTGYKLDARKQSGFKSSGQMLQYQLWGSLAYGRQWGGVHVGFLNLRDIGAGKGASAFASFEVASRPEAVALFPKAVCERAELMAGWLRAAEDAGRFTSEPALLGLPRAFREQGPCEDRYGPCDFFDACVGGA